MKSAFFLSRIFLVLLLCWVSCLLMEVPVRAEGCGAFRTAESMKGFADTLFYGSNLYRATMEYERFVYCYPAHPDIPKARFNIAAAAQLVGDYPSALEYYQTFLSLYPHHPLVENASRAIVEIEEKLAGR
jgi:hypothetical protein